MFPVLIVEDNPTFRLSLKELLRDEFPSFEISEAAEGKEALLKVETLHPRLIFMDIRLPGENGLRLTQKIKALHPEAIVIILTSYDLPEYREAAKRAKANYFITKGSATHELLEIVRGVISGSA
jgi:DNA-binding NarL/FixJ family response regulator